MDLSQLDVLFICPSCSVRLVELAGLVNQKAEGFFDAAVTLDVEYLFFCRKSFSVSEKLCELYFE